MMCPPRFLAAILACLAVISPGPAGAETPRDHVRRAEADTASPPASLAEVDWLVGYWIGDMPEGPVEQVFLPADKGQLPSFVRATNPDGIIFYEISNIIAQDGTLFIRLRHFTPGLSGWEDQSGPIDRRLLAIEGDTLYFDRVSFRRTGPDAYTVYFLNMDGDAERETLVIPFRRVAAFTFSD
ncbi:MAG: DUF6265 family protein [Hyphomonas sp.]